MPKLETHIISKNNAKKHPNSTNEIFRVVRTPRELGVLKLESFDYSIYASEYDRQWNSYYYQNPLLSMEDNGDKLLINKRSHGGMQSKIYELEFDEAQELLLLLLFRHGDRKAYEFDTYRKPRKRTARRSKKRSKRRK